MQARIKDGKHGAIRYRFARRVSIIIFLMKCVIEQILRADYVARQKRWEEEKARSAPDMPMVPGDEEMEVRPGSGGSREGINHLHNAECAY